MKAPVAKMFLSLVFLASFVQAQVGSGLIFNDPQGRISLQLGPGWTQLPTQLQGELGHYAYVQNGIVVAELSIASETLPMVLTPLQYAQAVEQNALKQLPQYQKFQERTVTLGGQEAYYYQFSILKNTQVGQTQMMTEQYFLVIQNTGYMITFMALPQQFNSIKPALDQVIQSLQYGMRPQTMPIQGPQVPAVQTAPVQGYPGYETGQLPANMQYRPMDMPSSYNTVQQYQMQQQPQLFSPATAPVQSQDTSSVMSSWESRNQAQDRMSQQWQEATMGYETGQSPSTGQTYDMPLNSYDPTVGGYRNPDQPSEVLDTSGGSE